MLKTLYARLVLWLIRPALHRRTQEAPGLRREDVLDIVSKDLDRNPRSPLHTAMEARYGLKRKW